MLKLYALPISVHSAKVRLALRIKDIPFQESSPPGGYGSTEYRTLVSSGTIPALVTGRGVLFESEAIVEYIEERWPDPALLPVDLYKRGLIRSASRYHDSRIEPLVRILFPCVSAPHNYSDEFKQSTDLLNERLLRLSESHLPKPYLASNILTMADLAYPSTLMMAEAILGCGGYSLEMPSSLKTWLKLLMTDKNISMQVQQVKNALDKWLEKNVEKN